MASNKYEIDMCKGPILPKVLQFALPLMLSTLLQLMFNAVDMIVVGRFTGSEALAAVGATGSLLYMMVCLFIGLATGTNILVARYYGAQDVKDTTETVHTSVMLSLIFGVCMAFIGFFAAPYLLTLMGTPENVLEQAALYTRIYFIGMPVNILYNFGSAIMRAVGDTKRPLYFLVVAGVTNVVLNLISVIIFKMGVAGVAIATVVSQTVSAILVVLCLIRSDSIYRLYPKKLRVHKDKFFQILQIGLPAGLQSVIFSFSSVLIQSSLNTFGAAAIAGSTASANVEAMTCDTFANSVYQANLSFVSQNAGAKKYGRLNRIAWICAVLSVIGSIVLGILTVVLGETLISFYTSDPAVIELGLRRMRIMMYTRFLLSMMDCMAANLRGLGYSLLPTIVSITGVCGLRLVWLFTVFAAFPTLEVLFMSYPITWALTAAGNLICFLVIRRKLPKHDAVPETPENLA